MSQSTPQVKLEKDIENKDKNEMELCKAIKELQLSYDDCIKKVLEQQRCLQETRVSLLTLPDQRIRRISQLSLESEMKAFRYQIENLTSDVNFLSYVLDQRNKTVAVPLIERKSKSSKQDSLDSLENKKDQYDFVFISSNKMIDEIKKVIESQSDPKTLLETINKALNFFNHERAWFVNYNQYCSLDHYPQLNNCYTTLRKLVYHCMSVYDKYYNDDDCDSDDIDPLLVQAGKLLVAIFHEDF